MICFQSMARRCRGAWNIARVVYHSESVEGRWVKLYYPASGWYGENADEILRLVEITAERLQRDLGLPLPTDTCCVVTDPETAVAIQGVTGAAYRDLVVIGFRERQLATFGRIAGHELAHLCSRSLSTCVRPFLCEGFACWAAARIEVDQRPCGLPLHFHLAWLLSVGVKPRLAELWGRRDYCPELYDLAWSFASFTVEQFGQERYFALYRAEGEPLEKRMEAVLGRTLAQVEREWFECARSRVGASVREISRTRRYDGSFCSLPHLARRCR